MNYREATVGGVLCLAILAAGKASPGSLVSEGLGDPEVTAPAAPDCRRFLWITTCGQSWVDTPDREDTDVERQEQPERPTDPPHEPTKPDDPHAERVPDHSSGHDQHKSPSKHDQQ